MSAGYKPGKAVKTDAEGATHERAMKQFETASGGTAAEMRVQWRDDMRFGFEGEQWDQKIQTLRENAGKPCLVFNKLAAQARQIINDARQAKPGIQIYPESTDADAMRARVFEAVVSGIEATSDAESAYDTAIEHAVYAGFGAFRVVMVDAVDQPGAKSLAVKRIANPLALYPDRGGVETDARDWNYAFVLGDKLTTEEFEKRYPGKECVSFAVDGQGGEIEDDEDGVQIMEWYERVEETYKAVMMPGGQMVELQDAEQTAMMEMLMGGLETVELTRKVVTHRLLSGADVLEQAVWPGEHIPICPVYGEDMLIDGERVTMGIVRRAMDAQRMINYGHSMAAEAVQRSMRAPFVAPKGAFKSDPNWQMLDGLSAPILEYDGQVPPQRLNWQADHALGTQEAQLATNDLHDVTGIYPAALGAKSNETSGVAIQLRDQAGDTGSFHYMDNLNRAIAYCGRILVQAIPLVYQPGRILSIVGPENQRDVMSVQEGMFAGRYGVVAKAGSNYTTRRREARASIEAIVMAYPAAAPILADALVKLMDIPGGDKISARFAAMLPPQIQAVEGGGDPQLMQLQQQLQQAEEAIRVLKAQADTSRAQVQVTQDAVKLQGQVEVMKAKQQADKLQAETQLSLLELEQKSRGYDLDAQELHLKMRQAELKHQEEMVKMIAKYESEKLRSNANRQSSEIEAINLGEI